MAEIASTANTTIYEIAPGGFEPPPKVPKTFVLPLHQGAPNAEES